MLRSLLSQVQRPQNQNFCFRKLQFRNDNWHWIYERRIDSLGDQGWWTVASRGRSFGNFEIDWIYVEYNKTTCFVKIEFITKELLFTKNTNITTK